MLSKIKNFVYTSKEKAFVGGLVAGVSSYLVQNGLTYHDLLSWSAVWSLVVFLVCHQAVYWTANK